MGGRAIDRSDARYGDAADRGRLQRLLLHPAPAAERTRRGTGGAASAQGDAAGTLVRLRIKVTRVKPRSSSFRDAPLGAGPESICPVVVMDSGLALTRAPE